MAHQVLLPPLGGVQVSLKLLHPFMPFVTEAVWQRLPRGASQGTSDPMTGTHDSYPTNHPQRGPVSNAIDIGLNPCRTCNAFQMQKGLEKGML